MAEKLQRARKNCNHFCMLKGHAIGRQFGKKLIFQADEGLAASVQPMN